MAQFLVKYVEIWYCLYWW